MKITITLSKDSIKEAKEQLRKYKKSLPNKQRRLMFELAKRGYRVMEEEISNFYMPYSTGALKRHIVVRLGDDWCTISNDSDHALYVEFGTGIVGAQNPYPNNKIGYRYDINGHGEDGWYYYDEDEKRIRWTKGMRSRPFVHNTYLKLKDEVVGIAKEVFRSDRQ